MIQVAQVNRRFVPQHRETARPTICQLLHTLHVGGAEIVAARLARQLKDSCRFLFVCLDEPGTMGEKLRTEGFEIEVLGRRDGVDWRCAYRLAEFLRRQQVDLIHAHQYTPFFYALFARMLHRKPAVLFTEHGRHFPDYPRLKRKVVNRLMLEQRDRVVGVGQAVRQALIDNEGIPSGRVGVIYNGIEVDESNNSSDERDSTRRELGIDSDDLVIIQVARLDYLKDHATAIRTMKRVIAKCPNAKLLLVGDGPERSAIEQLVNAQQLQGSVRFLGLRHDVGRLLAASDLFLLTSISEGIPLTIIEAMAAGLPVVATRVGGVPEIVEEPMSGLLAPAGDDTSLADHIARLVGDPLLCRQLGHRGRERAVAVFSESQMHSHYLALYQDMLRG